MILDLVLPELLRPLHYHLDVLLFRVTGLLASLEEY